jgi:snRNA-activating protein complex subunit 3
MKRKKQSFTEHKVERMSGVRIIDLTLRIGYPYIYMHQGHCEHLMIFTDLRLMNVNDVHELEDYPIRVYDAIHTITCCACRDAAAS